jgi:hypothetical protein
MSQRNKLKIELEGKLWSVEDFMITELGFLYVKLYNEKDKRYLNYRISDNYDPKNNFILDLIQDKNTSFSGILYQHEQLL